MAAPGAIAALHRDSQRVALAVCPSAPCERVAWSVVGKDKGAMGWFGHPPNLRMPPDCERKNTSHPFKSTQVVSILIRVSPTLSFHATPVVVCDVLVVVCRLVGLRGLGVG